MNVIGRDATVAKASDPTVVGRRGTVVLETARTLVLDEGARKLVVQKLGTEFRLGSPDETVRGGEIAGRLEDRLRARKP